MAERLIICGSPFAGGTCERISRAVAAALAAKETPCAGSAAAEGAAVAGVPAAGAPPATGTPSPGTDIIYISEAGIAPCRGCNACSRTGRCIVDDRMTEVLQALDEACELVVVCPVFFAGPPAQFKALLDRIQPLYWTRVAAGSARSGEGGATAGAICGAKRPLRLLIVGGGGDPHGYQPLIGSTVSALSCAGFELVQTVPLIGMDADAAIQAALEALAPGGDGILASSSPDEFSNCPSSVDGVAPAETPAPNGKA